MKDKHQLKAKEDELWATRSEKGEDPILKGEIDAIGFLLGEIEEPITDEDVPVPQSDEDLDSLITHLKDEKKSVAEYSAFGDPNWRIIDAQIEICEWAKGGE